MNKVFFKLFIHGRGLPMVLRGAGMLRCPVRAFLRSALPCLTQRHAFSCCCLPVLAGLRGAASDRQACWTWSRDRNRPTSAPSTPSSTDSSAKRGVGARDTGLLDFLVSTPAILEVVARCSSPRAPLRVLAARACCACLLLDVLPPAIARQSTHAGNRGGRVVPLLRAALWCPCSTLAAARAM
jgi:hypothetical protein